MMQRLRENYEGNFLAKGTSGFGAQREKEDVGKWRCSNHRCSTLGVNLSN